MDRERSQPSSARVLTRWVDAYARERGLPPKRVRDWISFMILGGRLERVSSSAEGPRFTIKGAVALEMRLPSKARATKGAACREVFEVRARHEWPPVLDPPTLWEDPFAALAEDLELPVGSLADAVQEAKAFIEAIDAANRGQ